MLRFLLFWMFLLLLYRKWLIVSKSNQMAGSLALEGPELLAHVLSVGRTQEKSLICRNQSLGGTGIARVQTSRREARFVSQFPALYHAPGEASRGPQSWRCQLGTGASPLQQSPAGGASCPRL